MIVGVIKNRDIFLHPLAVLSIQGLRGFFKILFRAFSRTEYRFIDLIEITTRTFVGKKIRS